LERERWRIGRWWWGRVARSAAERVVQAGAVVGTDVPVRVAGALESLARTARRPATSQVQRECERFRFRQVEVRHARAIRARCGGQRVGEVKEKGGGAARAAALTQRKRLDARPFAGVAATAAERAHARRAIRTGERSGGNGRTFPGRRRSRLGARLRRAV